MSTLELYQEQVPFSNKRLDRKISANNAYTNPVVIPFAFDFTSALNTLECVIYVKNTSLEYRYENIVVSLIEDEGNGTLPAHATISDSTIVLLDQLITDTISDTIIPLGNIDAFFYTSKFIDLGGVLDVGRNNILVKHISDVFWSIIGKYTSVSYFDGIATSYTYGPGYPSVLNTLNSIDMQAVNSQLTIKAIAPGRLVLSENGEGRTNITINDTVVTASYPDHQVGLNYGESAILISDPEVSQNGYYDSYKPINSDNTKLDVRFSYGYDEISSVEWESKGNALIIPYIGKGPVDGALTGTPDTAYHPIRMRITWKDRTELFTVRDYFIDVSYQSKLDIGA
jgi:hypothetical protein